MLFALFLLGVVAVHAGKDAKPVWWPDRVYTQTNSAANALVVLQLDADWNLNYLWSIPTGGAGADMGLGNQGALASSGNWLFAVNAGSNSISTFWLDPEGVLPPRAVSWVNSGGSKPRSLTVWGNWLFVLNEDSVVGFQIWANGTLTMVPNSWQACASDGNVQVQFSNWGRYLVVAQRGTTQKGLMVFPVDQWGVVKPGKWFASGNEHVPFGFDIDAWDRVFLAETGSNSLSSWQLRADGTLQYIARNNTLQLGTCWATLTPNGMFAYTANAGTDTVSGFAIDKWAGLWRVDADGKTAAQATGTHTTDLDVSADGQFLYALTRGAVYAYSVGSDGHLTQLAWWTNTTVLPNTVTGILVPKLAKVAKAPASSKKGAVIGGVVGGLGGATAIFLVKRRRKSQKPVDPKPMNATEVVQVHV